MTRSMLAILLAAIAATAQGADPYGGYPTLPGLAAIAPVISASRASGRVPFALAVSAAATTAVGALSPYDQLEYAWDFADVGAQAIRHPVDRMAVDASGAQRGPEAAYVYRRPGTYVVTLRVRGWDGERFVSASVTTTVVALGWPTAPLHVDPDAGDDAAPGTAGSPKRSWAAVRDFLAGGDDRSVLLRRGTTIIADRQLKLEGVRGTRLGAYGAGERPLIRAAGPLGDGMFKMETGHGYGVADVVCTDIAFDGGEAQRCVFSIRSGNGDPALPIGALEDIYFVDCAIGGGVDNRVEFGSYVDGRRAGFWRCAFDCGDRRGQGLMCAWSEWFFVVGGSFTGGDGRLIYDHHIYPSIRRHALYRWIDFGAAVSRNFCINNNAPTRAHGGEDHRWQLVDGCDVSGTMNGLDWSNTDSSGADTAFDDVIVQDCALHHGGAIGDQGIGIYTTGLRRFTARDNDFYANPLWDIVWSDADTYPLLYRNRFWKSASALAPALRFTRGADAGADVRDNVFSSAIAAGRGEGVITIDAARRPAPTFSGNRYFTPALIVDGIARPFVDVDSGTRLDLAAWRALGFDADGTYGDPGWQDPANGRFGDSAPPPDGDQPPPSSSVPRSSGSAGGGCGSGGAAAAIAVSLALAAVRPRR
ncbi:MAG: PKD domain-containing protein [Planctomycetes bacterium]|nr:PKD domain-containing protein [Planctomycetota bacterium]